MNPSYVIEKEHVLGVGAKSIVYKGYSNDYVRDPVAIKVVDCSAATQLNRVLQEVRILEDISTIIPDKSLSPFVHIYDAMWTANYHLQIVTELVKGVSLDVFLTRFRHGLPESIAKPIFKSILQAVQLLHENEFCHLDLKLENIMYDPDTSKIKILDFGFAQNTEKLQNNYCGSLHYLSPEILKQSPYEGKKSDIWSLGVCLYVLLTEIFPFDSKRNDSEEIFCKIERARYCIPSFVSPEAQDLIKQMTAIDPTDRPSIAALLKHPWF